ncbi:hypothetical protein ACHAXT_009373 [Thalassiosira profunda]
MTPSERYALWRFEQKYRSYTAETGQGDSSLGHEIYHDSCLHFMDGLPMNKSAIARFHRDLIGSGTKRRVVEFHVIDSTHVESVIHTRSDQGDLYVRCAITLKDGKIYRVEKMHSALPPPLERKCSGAQAA